MLTVNVTYELLDNYINSRPSLFVLKNIKAGEFFTEENVRSIRQGYGFHAKYFKEVIGKVAKVS